MRSTRRTGRPMASKPTPRDFSVLRPLAGGCHLYQLRIELAQHGDEIALRLHDFTDVLVRHWHFVQSRTDERHAGRRPDESCGVEDTLWRRGELATAFANSFRNGSSANNTGLAAMALISASNFARRVSSPNGTPSRRKSLVCNGGVARIWWRAPVVRGGCEQDRRIYLPLHC